MLVSVNILLLSTRKEILVMGQNEEYEEGTVTLTLDDDTEVECAIVAIFPAGDKEYIALLHNLI